MSSAALQFLDAPTGALVVGTGEGRPLWHYVFAPTGEENESPRPYIHPLYSPDGDILTNWRPNDHPWHHGLSFTLTAVDGVNFWGGPSHRPEDGYQWRPDQGRQRHIAWDVRTPERVVERLEWVNPHAAGGEDPVILLEERHLLTAVTPAGWTLEWISRVRNPGTRDCICHNYHSLGGMVGSHYTGLQFRAARALLDQHGDDRIGVRGPDGETDPAVLHGREADWIEWHVQTDTTLRRYVLRFESPQRPIPWFLRPENPLVAFAPHREEPLVLPAGVTTEFHHRLHILHDES